MKVIGIDPGLSGAIASWDGEMLHIDDMPTLEGKTRGRDLDMPTLWDIARMKYDAADHAFVEQVGAMPGQGVSSMFKFGYVAGAVRMLVVVLGVAVTPVSPVKWKAEMGCSSSKDKSRARALELFPTFAYYFSRKKDEGRAEAALIARYGYDKLRGEQHGRRNDTKATR